MNNSGERRRVEVVGLLPHEAHFVITGLAKAIETRDLLRGEYIDDVTAKEGRVAKFQTSGRISKEYHDQARRVEIIEALGLVAGNPAYILEYPDPRLESVTVGSRVTVSGSDEVTGEWKDIFDIVTHDIPEIEPSEGVTFRTTETSVGAALIGRVVGDTVGWLGRNRVPIIARVVEIDQEAQKQSYAN